MQSVQLNFQYCQLHTSHQSRKHLAGRPCRTRIRQSGNRRRERDEYDDRADRSVRPHSGSLHDARHCEPRPRRILSLNPNQPSARLKKNRENPNDHTHIRYPVVGNRHDQRARHFGSQHGLKELWVIIGLTHRIKGPSVSNADGPLFSLGTSLSATTVLTISGFTT